MPNPITKKMEFYNELTTELYEAIYDLIPYLQFKSYLLGQRITRSKTKDSVSNIISSVRDVYCVENTKLNVEEFLQELSDVKKIIEASRSSLFIEKMNVKPWKVNGLVFYDKQLEVIEERVKELNNVHTKVSANALTFKRKFPASIAKSSETKRRKTRQAENRKKSETRMFARLLHHILTLME